MKLLRLVSLTLLVIFFCFTLYAQFPPPVSGSIEVNQVKATMLSDGSMFTDGQSGQFTPVVTGLAELSLLQNAGFWIVGKNASGAYQGAVQTDAITDFVPGIQTPTQPYPLNHIWGVNCADIRQHVADFEDNGVVDHPNEHVFGWPGIGNAFFETYNPGQILPNTAISLGSMFDRGLTYGTYDPNEGDLPSLELRGCPLSDKAPDQMNWFTCTDWQPTHASGLLPIGLAVQVQVFAYAAPLYQSNQTIFVRYKLINLQNNKVKDCYIGAFADFSVGYPGDDFAGSDVDKRMLFAYNGDEIDESGFGEGIPAVGMDILRGPIGFVNGDFGAVPLAHLMILDNLENLQAEDYYELLSGKFADGTPAPNNGIMYAGNPNDPNGLSEITAGNTPGKRYGLASFGPFDLDPGAVNELIVAYFFAHSPGASPKQNAEKLLYNLGPQLLFDGCFQSTNNECSISSAAFEPVTQEALKIYPNPANSLLRIESENADFVKIEVSNQLGQVVLIQDLPQAAKQSTLDLGHVQAGVYMIRAGSQVAKVVVQR